METTFGLPHFRFPPNKQVIGDVLKFVEETLDDGGIPVLLGYSLGKAQEILCALAQAGHPVMLHKSILELTDHMADWLRSLPNYKLFNAAHAAGHVLVFPPSNARSLAIRKLKVARTAMLTGWALQPGAKYRYQVDEIFPLSDHADYPELIETVEKVEPRRIYLVHGYTREFAADLRHRGYDAWTLEASDQLELSVGGVVDQTPVASPNHGDDDPSATASAADSFSRWAGVCAKTSTVSSRLQKTALLADYLRALGPEDDLLLAARYCSGITGDVAAGDAPLNTGWALLRRSLQELTRVNDADYRAISRSQSDAGRTAYLVLQRGVLEPRPCSLEDIATLFAELRQAKGQMSRMTLLIERLRHLSAVDGSWLVRLLTGELRMGSKEGLIEEAVAEAFGQPADAVREAAMLMGDIGRAAVLARAGQLHEARPRPFVPLKVMLASPEETAEAVWERLHPSAAQTEVPATVWLEDKFDGIRAQLHRTAERVEIFTRDLKPISLQFPEIVAAAQKLRDDVILDGEIIAYAEDKKLSFFDLQKRLGRRDQADLFLPSDISVRYVIFDLLWRNGESLLGLPMKDRRWQMETLALPPDMALIRVQNAASAGEIEAAFLAARRRNNEGLIAKDPDSAYSPGRRGRAWLKLKKAFSTLDVVVVKAEQGHGKRSHVLSDYTFAIRDEDTGALLTIGKAYSGLTDVEIEELTEHFTQNTLNQRGSVRSVVPDTVLEIAFDSIQPSDRHDSGLALRFPRIKAIRRDKTPRDIDTLAYARRLAGA
jgi:DNA ligase-1